MSSPLVSPSSPSPLLKENTNEVIESPRVVRVKLLKPDSSGHMERIFLSYADKPLDPSGIMAGGAFMTASSFIALTSTLAGLPEAAAATALFEVSLIEQRECA